MHGDSRKVGIVGLGNVGITAAYALLLRQVVDELVLVSRSATKIEGERLDLEHSLPFIDPVKITASTEYAALADADVVVITAGAAQKPGQTRLDLVAENKQVMVELAEKLKPYVQNSVVVVVSNPVDILTYQLAKLLELPAGRVVGTGTMLDTARFRFHLSEVLKVNPRSIHAYVLGEHGDTSFPTLAYATIGGQRLDSFPTYNAQVGTDAFIKTKTAAAKIIEAKGATYYAIGAVIAQLVKTILQNQRSVLPVSTPIENYYGQSNLAISIPCIVGRSGVEQRLWIELSQTEQEQFHKSCQVIQEFL